VSVTPPIGEMLRAVEPDRTVDAAAAYLTEHHHSLRIEVLLADYRISGLWPVMRSAHAAAGLLADQSGSTRAYASQRIVVESIGDGTRVLLPLSVRHDRVGVLVVDLADPPTDDQLADLNHVADELAVAIMIADRSTDRYRRARRRHRLTMAAEMQWDLLPGRAIGGPSFLLAGQLEPAYAVCGDHFDWSLDGDRLTITTLDGDGYGIEATMLTMLAVNAMRNARRSGGNLIEQAELASDTVFGVYGGKRSVATLLFEVDVAMGVVLAIDAGSPRSFRVRDGRLGEIKLDHQLPLGMFGESRYEMHRFRLEPRDRLFIVSDGVHGAAPGEQEPYGDRELTSAIRDSRLQPATEAVASVMRGLHKYHDRHDLQDDAVIVCLDWFGLPVDEAESQPA
jgi:serine phosphatase RsbU (regulator of sigma subunit)